MEYLGAIHSASFPHTDECEFKSQLGKYWTMAFGASMCCMLGELQDMPGGLVPRKRGVSGKRKQEEVFFCGKTMRGAVNQGIKEERKINELPWAMYLNHVTL